MPIPGESGPGERAVEQLVWWASGWWGDVVPRLVLAAPLVTVFGQVTSSLSALSPGLTDEKVQIRWYLRSQ